MFRKKLLLSKIMPMGAVVVVSILALGAFGAVGMASATHYSCGTYCWNEFAPYPNEGVPSTQSGNGQYSLNEQVDDSDGYLLSDQDSQASYSEQEILYAEPWIEGNPIVFYTPVGVTLTFTTTVQAAYSVSGWCDLEGEWIGLSEVYVTVGFVGTSYTSTATAFSDPGGDTCDILSPHNGGTSNGITSVVRAGTASATLVQTVADDIPAGTYTPFVQVYVETYFEAIGAAGGTASVNMETGNYGAYWYTVNLNWGPGEG